MFPDENAGASHCRLRDEVAHNYRRLSSPIRQSEPGCRRLSRDRAIGHPGRTRPSAAYTALYPQKMPATVRLQDGSVIEHEVQDYPGLASRPFTWEESVAKFDTLVAGRIDQGVCREIKEAVRSLETIQARDLTNLLGRSS